jgi:hypothetical protein
MRHSELTWRKGRGKQSYQSIRRWGSALATASYFECTSSFSSVNAGNALRGGPLMDEIQNIQVLGLRLKEHTSVICRCQ